MYNEHREHISIWAQQKDQTEQKGYVETPGKQFFISLSVCTVWQWGEKVEILGIKQEEECEGGKAKFVDVFCTENTRGQIRLNGLDDCFSDFPLEVNLTEGVASNECLAAQ